MGFSDAYSPLPTLCLVTLLFSRIVGAVQSSECPVPTVDASSFSQIEFDYLIVGGGTAGLTLASRLSENPLVVVGVLESGIFHQNDPLINVPGQPGAFGNSNYDWNFFTAPQTGLGGRSVFTSRGKMLGGSSGINGMAWTRASRKEIDAFESFAPNSGWNWDGLLPYFKKCESVLLNSTSPISSQTSLPNFEGDDGPIQVSRNAEYSDIVPQYIETLTSLGISTNPSPHNGTSTGISNTFVSVDRPSGSRSYAATTYYCLASSRSNFHVLLNAHVTKVVFGENTKPAALTAEGVEFVVGSQTFTANARREVIISAGTVQTPQVLELSGIGNRAILNQAGVTTLLDLPGVGENVQEHMFTPVQFLLKPGHHTFDELRNNASFAAEQLAQYDASRTGLLAATDSILSFIPFADFVEGSKLQPLLASFDEVASQPGLSPLQQKQYIIQREWLTQLTVPQLEIILYSRGFINPAAGESYITLLGGNQHPLGRGSVHVDSNDPLAPPLIAANYLNNPFDTSVAVEFVRFATSLLNIDSLASVAQNVTHPASFEDADILSHVKATIAPGCHILGSASMAPYNIGGVVDSELKVYNTTNLRVVDASIIPIHVGAHVQSLVYVIAEKAADIIQASSY